MKKKSIFLIIAALVLVAVIVAVVIRLNNHGKDIIGVTTLDNTVIMNAKTGDEFVSGEGYLNVGEKDHIHVEYNLKSGSLDLAFHKGSDSLEVFKDADLENLADSGDIFGKSGISGKGSLDFEAESGEYTVYFNQHAAVGTAKVTAKANK